MSTGFDSIAQSHLLRVLALGFLILVLHIPVSLVRGLIEERQLRRSEAVHEVSQKWGGNQVVEGPYLVVPYELRSVETAPDGTRRVRTYPRHATFLAKDLRIDGAVEGEVRERGIFEVPVYSGALALGGQFDPPDFSTWRVPEEQIQWDRAVLAVKITDARAIQAPVQLRWGGRELEFEPGLGYAGALGSGIHAKIGDPRSPEAVAFESKLRLHGSGGLYVAPLGAHTEVSLRSDWPHPSFQGAWLPTERSVTTGGFEAEWRVSSLGRSYPQAWTSENEPHAAVASSHFGVDFITPVDPYRLSERAAKYDLLFLGLTFLALWLFEVLAGVRVHAVQYLLLGAAMSLFYLLLLALSEHTGVSFAYGVATAGIVTLIAGYAVAVLGRRLRGLAMGGIVASLYGYLYVLLRNEDHALLVGSLGLFVVLAAVMWLTRRVDWFEQVRWTTPSEPGPVQT
ncbi:MAG: cell envelope integrity protein CreD [Myxococcota bacterium]